MKPGRTISARNAQIAEVSLPNHVISALHMVWNVEIVAKLTTGQECVAQNPSEKHIAGIEKILEDARGLEPVIDEIRNSHLPPET